MIPSTRIPRYSAAEVPRIANLEINPNSPGKAPITKSVSPQFSPSIAAVEEPPFVARSFSSVDVSGTQCPARKIIGTNVIISPWINGPTSAPRTPPLTFPNTPEVAPRKK